jgi:hypothetical protein
MADMLSSRTLTHTTVTPTPQPGLPAQRFLVDALERALVGRASLMHDDAATPPGALHVSAAHIEQLLARLAALEPPAPPVTPAAGRQRVVASTRRARVVAHGRSAA